MRRPIARYIHSMSLGARIVWVFILTAVFSIFIFASSFHFIIKQGESPTFPRLINDYSELLLQELGLPANREKAKAIKQRTGIDFIIEKQGQRWTTFEQGFDEYALDLDDVEFHHHKGEDKKFGFHHGIALLEVTRADESVWLVVSFRRNPVVGMTILVGFVSLMVLWIYLAYRMVRYLISPIKEIQSGVQKFSEGNLEWRIPIKREDDLGELTGEINQMAEQIRQMLESKRQLLLAISHELRTPLTRLNIALDLPANENNKAKMKSSLQLMDRLIGELLESEKLSANHSALSKEEVDLERLLADLIELDFQPENNIEYKAIDQGCKVEADVMRVRLLFRNLISNAVKYGEQKNIKVRCFKQGEKVVTKISDQGEGIGEENLARIFEPFFREDKARQRQTGGTGLGLYLVKMIVDAHGGEIEVKSKKGKGTEITITL